MMKEALSEWTYRFTMDDNILFLQDLAGARYSSLFEQPYLAFWKAMHDTYGVRLHFNVHGRGKEFSLTQLSAVYRPEWVSNSDWIRLTFHQMDEPASAFSYAESSYHEVKKDYREVTAEIRRFAGEKLVSPFTTIHHAACSKAGCEALRDCGVRGLGGGTWRESDGQFPDNYYLTHSQTGVLAERGVLREDDLGLYFLKFDVALHRAEQTPSEMVEELRATLCDTSHWHHLEVTFEEWALEPSSGSAMPDAQERVEKALSALSASGIRPVFLEEIL